MSRKFHLNSLLTYGLQTEVGPKRIALSIGVSGYKSDKLVCNVILTSVLVKTNQGG